MVEIPTNTDGDNTDEAIVSNQNKSHLYGWKYITSEHIQMFNRPVVFLIFLCIGGFVQGTILFGYISSAISSVEKEFGLSSTQVASFKMAACVTSTMLSIFIAYFCSSHKPRYISCGILVLAVASLAMCIPKLIIGPYIPIKSVHFCNNEITYKRSENCQTSKTWIYQMVFIVSFILQGIGGVPFYTIARSHIDDICNREQAAKYMGVYMAVNQLGMSAGYMTAAPILRIWVDIIHPLNTSNVSHANWVGAWWMGFLVGGFLLLLIVIPMFGFPREFPDTAKIKAMKKDLQDTVARRQELTTMCSSIKALLKNLTFLFITLGTTLEQLVVFGFTLFLPKLHEIQYHFSASNAALYSGMINLFGGMSGALFGGLLIKRFKWNCKDIIRNGAIVALLATISSAFILVPCNINEVGAYTPDDLLNKECGRNCNCGPQFHPICATDQKTFCSPCYAGCGVGSEVNNTFHNCSCFSPNVTVATNGRCTTEKCALYPLFFVGMCILYFFVFLNEVPYTNITLRIVDVGEGSIAMGFQNTVICLLGLLPSPPLYGVFTDKSCNRWKTVTCHGDAHCLEYDTVRYKYYMFGIVIIFNFFGFVCLLMAYKFYRMSNLNRKRCQTMARENITYTAEE